ncbi:hypothetical protein AB2L27_19690 [Kineococcus sp. LSe6-4]|uniref:Uncharacterized protein n=1 Tax=Kineococcus halophytocola TaxID=3234027 RepID=A0ABV4H8F1_9ACTN
MLHPRTHLSADDLRAVADLEDRVVAHDGGRLKIEWGEPARPLGRSR